MTWDGVNQRKFPRVSYKCLIHISRGAQEETLDAITENIGAGGICVVLEKNYGLFENVSLELFLGDETKPILCSGVIVWVVKRRSPSLAEEIKYDTGIEFRSVSQEDRDRITRLMQNILIERP